MEETTCPACARYKKTPRGSEELKDLKTRINRTIGQLNGISKMLEDNRYCGDVLTQISAVKSAIESIGYIVLEEHLKTCVIEQVKIGNNDIMDEALALMKKLK